MFYSRSLETKGLDIDMVVIRGALAIPKYDVSNRVLLQATVGECMKRMPPTRTAMLSTMTLKANIISKLNRFADAALANNQQDANYAWMCIRNY